MGKREGKLEREKEGERKEGNLRERGSNFSLNFSAIGPSVSGKERSKVAPHGKGYAWVPVLWSFENSRRYGSSPTRFIFRFKSLVNGLGGVRP